jgi:hypothetical protein
VSLTSRIGLSSSNASKCPAPSHPAHRSMAFRVIPARSNAVCRMRTTTWLCESSIGMNNVRQETNQFAVLGCLSLMYAVISEF